MFLFQSKQEKAVRQDIEKSMQICISHPKKYNEAKEVLLAHLKGSDQKVIEMIVDNVKATIKNEDYQPIRKYQAMLLLKDLMQTHNKALGKYVVKKFLKRLNILAQHKSSGKEQKEQERGKDIFGQVKKDQEQHAIKFFNILLTALQQWGKNWPKAPDGPYKDFQRVYNDLLMNGTQFPKQRPKQLRQVVSAPKNSREQVRGSSANLRQPAKQHPKRQENPSPPSKLKNTKNSSIINDLRSNLDKFYEDTIQPLQLLSSLLPGCTSQQLPVIKDIIGQIQKTIQMGNQFVISIQGNPDYKTDDMKLQKCFDFINKIQKDLRILTKKPQQTETFKSKYVKLSNQLLQTLNKNKTPQLSPSKVQETSNQIDKSKPPLQKPTISQAKVEEPKIKNPNRYASVQGNQVLQQFSKTVEFQSNSGQSVNSDRFGSFGAPHTQRHRASIPTQQPTSPQIDKNKQSNSISQQQIKEGQRRKQISAIPEEKTIQMSKYVISQHQNNGSQLKPKLQSQKLFQEFTKVQTQKTSIKKIGNFEENNSFGVLKFQKSQQPPAQQQDFFAKVQQNNGQNREVNYNPRRKKNQQKQENEDFFNAKIPSRIDSSKLSGFNFSQIGQSSKNDKTNEPNNLQRQAIPSKKQVEENPFGLDAQSHHSSKKQQSPSNYFQKYDPNRSNSEDFFQRSSVRSHKQIQFKTPVDNPFATGNFGPTPQNNMPDPNPFDKQSLRSKQTNQKDNPFNNQSFQKMSKNSKKNIQNENVTLKEVQNPFESNFHERKNVQDSKLNLSANLQNPFETSTHKSNKSKNPFDQVQQFFKPPSRPSIDGLSERNSFKNIENQNKLNILGGNLGLSNIGQPIQDSLILSARIDNHNEQYGLNFSQFQDIGQPKKEDEDIRKSNPFNFSIEKKEENSFSGFSLSNFAPIKQSLPKQQKKPQLNISAADFFANYQKQSVTSKKSNHLYKNQDEVYKKQQSKFDFFTEKPNNITNKKQVKEREVFQDFNLSRQSSDLSRQQNKKSKQNKQINYQIQRQKTVLSNQQKSFDLAQLDKVSAIHKDPKRQDDFDVFTQWGKEMNRSNKQIKQGFQADNKSNKSLSWGDFDREQSPIEKENSKINRQQFQQTNQNKFLEVQSKLKTINQIHKIKSSNNSINNKISQQHSLELNLEDFAPLSKKGIQWNPLAKIATKIKQSPTIYNIDEKKIELKKIELMQKQKEYYQKLQRFKSQREENEKIRNIYIIKMKKIEEVSQQKDQFQQILKKIKQTNNLKQDKIEEIHQKIKKAVEVKQKILQKQRQLYEITKNQVFTQQKSSLTTRSMSSKWQIFNKTLQNNRNSMYTLQSHYMSGF